jgi:methylglutaconyl-CoA hydratase
MIEIHKIHSRITEIVLNRPEKKNALSHELMLQLCSAIESVQSGIIILKGKGTVFCSGLDLNELDKKETPELVAKTLSTLYLSGAITIAQVHGAALAGGAGIMSACDFVIASKNTIIGYPEVHRGIVPALVSGLLMRQVGQKRAKELLLLANPISAHQAKEMGLVNHVTEESALDQETVKFAYELLKGAPEALKNTKKLLEEIYPGDFEEEIHHAKSYHEKVRNSLEAKEGISAFLQKRVPKWE